MGSKLAKVVLPGMYAAPHVFTCKHQLETTRLEYLVVGSSTACNILHCQFCQLIFTACQPQP